MTHGVTGCVETLQLDGCADFDYVAGADALVHIRDSAAGVLMRDHFCPCRFDDTLVTARMIAVLVRIQDLRNFPAASRSNGKTFPVVQRINRQRIARLRARDEIIKIAVRIVRPNLLNDHSAAPASNTNSPLTQVCSTLMSSISEVGISK